VKKVYKQRLSSIDSVIKQFLNTRLGQNHSVNIHRITLVFRGKGMCQWGNTRPPLSVKYATAKKFNHKFFSHASKRGKVKTSKHTTDSGKKQTILWQRYHQQQLFNEKNDSKPLLTNQYWIRLPSLKNAAICVQFLSTDLSN